MKDSEALELIGAKHRERLLAAFSTMTANGATDAEIARVLSEMLVQSTSAAGFDGLALARRQLAALGIDLALDVIETPMTLEGSTSRAADRERFSKAMTTILANTEGHIAMRVGRLALAETINAAREATARHMRSTGMVRGWVRELDSDPCQLCQWWSRDGKVWPVVHDMPVHKGCACAQKWVR